MAVIPLKQENTYKCSNTTEGSGNGLASIRLLGKGFCERVARSKRRSRVAPFLVINIMLKFTFCCFALQKLN